jgi:hypothetical protein
MSSGNSAPVNRAWTNPPHDPLPAPTVPGPYQSASAPTRFVPPPHACDAHCHVFGPAASFAFSPDRSYTPPDSGIDDFERLQRTLGLSRAVFVQASCHGNDNAAMLDAIQRGDGRYAGGPMGRACAERVGKCALQPRLGNTGCTGHAFLRLCLMGKVPTHVPGHVPAVGIGPPQPQRRSCPIG